MRQAIAFLLMLALGVVARGQPAILKGVGIDQRLGQQLPLDVRLVDETGRARPLSEYLRAGRPVLLTLVYYKCPGLCTTTLNQVTRTLNALPESAGEAFDVLTISFDPREGAELAAEKKATYLRAYRRASAGQGWHFLTGSADAIGRLTAAAGFRYRWDEANQVYAHASAVIVVTPGGKVSRYFLGVDYPPQEVREALRAAGREDVGPEAERVFLYCFHYDPATGKYGLIIQRFLQVCGVVTFMALVGLVLVLVRRERRRPDVEGVAA